MDQDVLMPYISGMNIHKFEIVLGDQKRTMLWPIATYTHIHQKKGLNIDS